MNYRRQGGRSRYVQSCGVTRQLADFYRAARFVDGIALQEISRLMKTGGSDSDEAGQMWRDRFWISCLGEASPGTDGAAAIDRIPLGARR